MPDQSGYVVGWGTLTLINAGLAQGKGRSGLTWFAISLLLGPFATLLIVVLPAPGGEARPLRRSEWAVLGIVLVALVVIAVLGLLGMSVRAASVLEPPAGT